MKKKVMDFGQELNKVDTAASQFIRETVKKKKSITLFERFDGDEDETDSPVYDLPTVTVFDNDGRPQEECRVSKLKFVNGKVFAEAHGTESNTKFEITLAEFLTAERIYLADALKNHI